MPNALLPRIQSDNVSDGGESAPTPQRFKIGKTSEDNEKKVMRLKFCRPWVLDTCDGGSWVVYNLTLTTYKYSLY